MNVEQAIVQSARDLQQRVDEHRRLLLALEGRREATRQPCLMLDCACRRKLRRTVTETIAVLEETRRSFKSKELEQLRKRLIGVLAEDA